MQLTGWQQHKIFPLSRKTRPFSDPSGRVLKHPTVRRAIADRAKTAAAVSTAARGGRGGGGGGGGSSSGRKQKSSSGGE